MDKETKEKVELFGKYASKLKETLEIMEEEMPADVFEAYKIEFQIVDKLSDVSNVGKTVGEVFDKDAREMFKWAKEKLEEWSSKTDEERLELINEEKERRAEEKRDPDNVKYYPRNMLPGVSYARLEDDEDDFMFGASIVDLEYETKRNMSDFIDELKEVLIREKMVQSPEIMVSYLCAYLGFFAVKGLGKSDADELRPAIETLIETQSMEVYRTFLKYNIRYTKEKNENLQTMRENSPGSIVAQTIRLGRVIWDTMQELDFNRDTIMKQTEWFCPQTDFLKLLLKRTRRDIREWKERLEIKQVLYAVNQAAMQIAWLMGYFAYMDKEEPHKYWGFGLPLIEMYGEAVGRIRK